jgi:ribonuclease PH
MPRHDQRDQDQLRPIDIEVGFQRNAEGSVLYRTGGTVVLCTASLDDDVPKWMQDRGTGWLTAEYQMHPRANPQRRERREGRGGTIKGRTQEIQRLVGRSLRAAIDLKALGPRTITIDCDILEADGGTRTASVTAGFVATAMALYQKGLARVLHDQVAAISVGLVGGEVCVDLDYSEDSNADVDMNVVATAGGKLIEVQATSEKQAIERAQFDALLDAALGAMNSLCSIQREALEAANMSLAPLLKSDNA